MRMNLLTIFTHVMNWPLMPTWTTLTLELRLTLKAVHAVGTAEEYL